ncbi:DNA polymerase Y family protein [Pedobacter aquatilis]|uniref:Y-family DNA polymerase n=1 Tax=Pedobacter aquatilis TaxID=351343 RepID=UPI00292FF0F3|nr:DNA polymerase Y family protein [Pedobacter aquatilis]
MGHRFVSIWFYHLLSDWQVIRRPELNATPFVFVLPVHGRMIVTAVSTLAAKAGIKVGMPAADARAICPGLEVLDDKPGRAEKLLRGLGRWCIRYSPIVSIDSFSMDGLMLDVSGCTHLWEGERNYLIDINFRLKSKGYSLRCAIADSPGAAWAVSRYGTRSQIVPSGTMVNVLGELSPIALRLENTTLIKLEKLGFYKIKSFLNMQRSVLRRRFGEAFLLRLAQALGNVEEQLVPLQLPVDFRERLACMEPIRTRVGIEQAIEKLLLVLCKRLAAEGKGVRFVTLNAYRVDGKLLQVSVGTSSASNDVAHLFKLFALKIDSIRPGLGIELFELEAVKVDSVALPQESLWALNSGINHKSVLQLIDRVTGKIGPGVVHRYVPVSRYWPERSIALTHSIAEEKVLDWNLDKPRPTHLLAEPEAVKVMALVPDHPPRFFIHNGEQHRVIRADGPERIEREWWLDAGEHRDYYRVEDEKGGRFWIYRSGHYGQSSGFQWFIHGYFA